MWGGIESLCLEVLSAIGIKVFPNRSGAIYDSQASGAWPGIHRRLRVVRSRRRSYTSSLSVVWWRHFLVRTIF